MTNPIQRRHTVRRVGESYRDCVDRLTGELRAAEIDRDRLTATVEMLTGQGASHVYLSTSCFHGEHDYCASMTGYQGAKRGGQCKFCEAKCTCPCHTSEEN